ncbi:MAG: hypothetical protein C0402_07070 [Thermodesulfovibrio sp.]|nr:hypothetical protein [Thermodesulfovibrio sp.]
MKTLSRMIISGLFFFFLSSPAVFAGAAADNRPQPVFTKHFRQTFFAVTEKAEFSIEILPDEKEYKIGRNVVGIVVHDRHDRDVEKAELTVTAEGSTEPVAVKEKGEGLYLASNLDVKRQGTWKLTIQVRDKAVTDGAIFLFPAAATKLLPPGQYSGNDKQ